MTSWFPMPLFVVVLGIIFVLLPNLSRQDQFFAVTVLPSFRGSAEGRRILRAYRIQVVVTTALALCGFGLIYAVDGTRWVPLPLLIPAAGQLLATVRANKAARAFAVTPSGVRVASLQTQRPDLPGGWIAWVIPFLFLGTTGFVVGHRWTEIPLRFPIHWGLDGVANGWAARTPLAVFQLLLLGGLICGTNTFFAWQVRNRSRGSAALRKFNSRLLLASSYLLAILFSWITFQMALGGGKPGIVGNGIIISGVLAFVAGVLYFGKRAKARGDEQGRDPGGAIGDQTPDRRWLGGLIYYNPEDPALFVEQRMGVGFGINFGRPSAWVIVAGIAMLPLVAIWAGRG